MTITHSIQVDMVTQSVMPRVYAMQHDANTRVVEISLYAAGKEWIPPEDTVFALSYRKPDGTRGFYNKLSEETGAITVSGNKVSVVLAAQVLTAYGEVAAALVMNDEGMNRLASFPFSLYVTPDPSAGTVDSDDYFNCAGAAGSGLFLIHVSHKGTENFQSDKTYGEVVEAVAEEMPVLGIFTDGSVTEQLTPELHAADGEIHFLSPNGGGYVCYADSSWEYDPELVFNAQPQVWEACEGQLQSGLLMYDGSVNDAYDFLRVLVVEVESGASYRFTACVSEGVSMMHFKNANGAVISRILGEKPASGAYQRYTDWEVEVPEGAETMWVCSCFTYGGYEDIVTEPIIEKLVTARSLSDRVAGLEAFSTECNEQLEDISAKIDDCYAVQTTDIAIEITEGKFVYVDPSGSGGHESTVDWAAHTQFIPVTAGERLLVSCASRTNIPGVAYYKAAEFKSANLVGAALTTTAGTAHTDVFVTVPEGARYMVLNTLDAHPIVCKRIAAISPRERILELENEAAKIREDADYEIRQLERRATAAEKGNDFTWGDFDKSYFVFVHDDSNRYLTTAYTAFHEKGVPFSSAAIVSALTAVHNEKTVKEWMDLIVADGGEILCHYGGNLQDTTEDAVWYEKVVSAKRTFEENGFVIRGLILADSSQRNSAKGEKFCRRYYDYADKVGISQQYNLGRSLMLNYASLDAFKAHLATCMQKPGLYAFGFHGDHRADEAWITQEALAEIIAYITANENCEITTYSHVFDTMGTTKLEKRLAALEAKA